MIPVFPRSSQSTPFCPLELSVAQMISWARYFEEQAFLQIVCPWLSLLTSQKEKLRAELATSGWHAHVCDVSRGRMLG